MPGKNGHCAGQEENNDASDNNIHRDETAMLGRDGIFAGSVVRICDLKTNTNLNGERAPACSNTKGSLQASPFHLQYNKWSRMALTVVVDPAGLTATALEMLGNRVKLRIINGGDLYRGQEIALKPENITMHGDNTAYSVPTPEEVHSNLMLRHILR
jgi:hypothetical protein